MEQQWFVKAGESWDNLIKLFCDENKIPCKIMIKTKENEKEIESQPQDLIIETPKKQIGIELKATDLHTSTFKKGTAGSLVWELKDHYLNQFDQVWLIIAGIPDEKTLLKVASDCFRLGVKWKIYKSQVNAIHGIYESINNLDDIIDLSLPEYINRSDQLTTFDKMWRGFPGMTEEVLGQLHSEFPTKTPTELTQILPTWLDKNLGRLYFDWWNSGIEPKQNTLSKSKKKEISF